MSTTESILLWFKALFRRAKCLEWAAWKVGKMVHSIKATSTHIQVKWIHLVLNKTITILITMVNRLTYLHNNNQSINLISTHIKLLHIRISKITIILIFRHFLKQITEITRILPAIKINIGTIITKTPVHHPSIRITTILLIIQIINNRSSQIISLNLSHNKVRLHQLILMKQELQSPLLKKYQKKHFMAVW